MTQLQHIAWYNLVIANVYAVGGEGGAVYSFRRHLRALFRGFAF